MEDKKSLKEYLFAEVTIIQDIIKRMAINSFMIKSSFITLVWSILLARILGKKIVGYDDGGKYDKSCTVTAYYFRGVMYITKMEWK